MRALPGALANGQLQLLYQPIVHLPRGPAVGVEVSLCWEHPTCGVISDGELSAAAERCALTDEIADWVLEEATQQLGEWQRGSPAMKALTAFIDVSQAQLCDVHLVARITDVLGGNGLAGSSLCLQLPESLAIEDPSRVAAIVAKLRFLGVGVAIDHFGMDYSSLAYLKRFPAATLKLDRSLTAGVAGPGSADATLVAAIAALARRFKITAIASGVDGPAQATRLVELGFSAAQGNRYSRPVAPDQLPTIVHILGARKLLLASA